jgi:hypothetical protein
MIRADRVTKVYAGMKPEELAAIAFQFLTDVNVKELKAVESAVPWRRYRAMDLDYRHRLHCIFDMSAYWAIEYWKCQAMLMAGMAQSAESLRENDGDAAEMALDTVAIHRVRISTLVRAMEAVCRDFGIDPGCIWKLADAEPPSGDYLGEPKPEWLAEMTETLRALLTADPDWPGRPQ